MKRSKIYTKADPLRESKLYFLFCEGQRRETTYFHFFNKIASQIVVQLVPIEDGRNRPMGLYENARQILIDDNSSYSITDGDEVWFVIDTDEWGDEIQELREAAGRHKNWFVAQSNPSFEVWLYYHFNDQKPQEAITNWKQHLDTNIKGGFNCNHHPMHIEVAIKNSKQSFSVVDGKPGDSTSEVYLIGQRILPLVKNVVDELLKLDVENKS